MRLRELLALVPFFLGSSGCAVFPQPPSNSESNDICFGKTKSPGELFEESEPRGLAAPAVNLDRTNSVLDFGKYESARRGKGSRTLFEWEVGPKLDDDAEEPPTRMPNDTPHFTDNSATVGLGRVMLESGYTFTTDRASGIRNTSHRVPEELLRVGIFADWFEARFEWNYQMTGTTAPQQLAPDGAEDLGVGMRLALTEQKGWLPESALNVSISLPTGSSAFSANRILTEIRYHYSWEIVKDKVEFEANTIGYSDRDDLGQDYMVFVQSGNLEYSLTKKAELFFECYGLFPHGARSPIVLPQYYYHSGLTYFFTDNFALYCHAAVGLNRHADDFYTGVGVLARR